LLADGTSLNFSIHTFAEGATSAALHINVDINGHKKPNVHGRDFHNMFRIFPQTNEALPVGINTTTHNENTGTYKKASYEEISQRCTSGEGSICAAKILLDGFKMNY